MDPKQDLTNIAIAKQIPTGTDTDYPIRQNDYSAAAEESKNPSGN